MKVHPDGVDLAVCITVLEFEFRVTTFFYGFNLASFSAEAKNVVSSAGKVARLFNYDETIRLQFLRPSSGSVFLSVYYRSVVPDVPSSELADLQRLSALAASDVTGSQFGMHFLHLHTSLTDCYRSIDALLQSTRVSVANPYHSD
jgi:hypothetical protein